MSVGIHALLITLFEKRGTELTMKEVKMFLRENDVELPEKSELKKLIQNALDKFDSVNSETSSKFSETPKDDKDGKSYIIDHVVMEEPTEDKPKTERIVVNESNSESIDNEVETLNKNIKNGTEIDKQLKIDKKPKKTKKASVRGDNLPKNMKGPSSLYPYLKAATISIPYKKLKSMNIKEQYLYLVDRLTENFIVCNIALPSENKTTSKYYGCVDRKWTIDACKEVAEELELKREMQGLEIEGEVITSGSRRSRTSSKSKPPPSSKSGSEHGVEDDISSKTSVSEHSRSPNKRTISSSDEDEQEPALKKIKMI